MLVLSLLSFLSWGVGGVVWCGCGEKSEVVKK